MLAYFLIIKYSFIFDLKKIFTLIMWLAPLVRKISSLLRRNEKITSANSIYSLIHSFFTLPTNLSFRQRRNHITLVLLVIVCWLSDYRILFYFRFKTKFSPLITWLAPAVHKTTGPLRRNDKTTLVDPIYYLIHSFLALPTNLSFRRRRNHIILVFFSNC